MGFFATRRELKRLAESEKYWRDKANALEKELKLQTSLLLERDFAFVDRILTAKVGTFAIRDEVNSRVAEQISPSDPDSEQKAYLQARYNEILEDYQKEGLTEADAHRYYKELEPEFIETFQNF